jgi:hypothetical protein
MPPKRSRTGAATPQGDQQTQALTCPFPRCAKTFRGSAEIRSHLALTKVRADELHPADDPLWTQVMSGPLFTEYHPRPKNRTPEEKKALAAASSAKAYQKNKKTRVARAAERRTELRETANVAALLGDVMEPIVQAAENAVTVFADFQRLNAGGWTTFLCNEGESNTTPSVGTFFRLTAYFLPAKDWPVLQDPPPPPSSNETAQAGPLMAALLPGKPQFQTLSLAQHPDRNNHPRHFGDPEVQKVLNPSWSMWQDFLKSADGTAAKCTLPPDTADHIAEFQGRSEVHRMMYEYYIFWVGLAQDTQDMMTLSSSAFADVGPALVTQDMVAPSKDLIQRAKEGKRKLMERDARRPKRKHANAEGREDEGSGSDSD